MTLTTRTTYYTELPLAKRKTVLIGTLSLISFAQEYYDRSSDIDKLKASHFITHSLKYPPPLSPMESQLLDSSVALDGDAAFHKQFSRMRGSLRTHPLLGAFERRVSGDASWSKVVGVVDSSAEQVLAYLWEFMSFHRVEHFLKRNGRLPRYVVPINDSRSKVIVTSAKMPRGTQHRLFESWMTWKAIKKSYSSGGPTDVSYVLAVDTFDKYVELCHQNNDSSASSVQLMTQTRRGNAKGTRRGYNKIRVLARNVSELTIVTEEALGGRLPFWVSSFRAEEAIATLQAVQEHFNRNSREVDKELRQAFIARIPTVLELASKIETEQEGLKSDYLKTTRAYFDSAAFKDAAHVAFLKNNPLHIEYHSHRSQDRSGVFLVEGKATTMVDTSPEDFL